MNKKWIGIAGLAAVLAVMLVVVSLVSSGKRLDSGDEESLYSYSYSKTAKGMDIRVSGSFPKGSKWNASADNGVVAVQTKKQSGKTAVFQVSVQEPGQDVVRLCLEQASDTTEPGYEIAIEVAASSGGELTVLRNSSREATGRATGTGTGFTYEAKEQADGTVKVRLVSEEEMDWALEVEGTSVRAELNQTSPTEELAVLHSVGLGQSWVRLKGAQAAQAVELYVATDKKERVSVIRHQLIPYTPTGSDPVILNDPRFEQTFGSVLLPEDAFGVETAMTAWPSDDRQAGYVGFLMDGYRWELYLFQASAPADWCSAQLGQDTPVEGVPVTVGSWGQGASAVWTMGEYSYLLRCDEVTAEQVKAAAVKVITAV